MDEKKAAQVKKMEAESEALMQAIRAELDIQKKQKLIAGMSHDLKSPPDLYPGL